MSDELENTVEKIKLGKLDYTDIIVEKKPPVGYVTINRPEKRNALTMIPGGTCDQLAQAFQSMAEDPDIQVFQLKGTGDCFTAGFDMSRYIDSYWGGRDSGYAKGMEKEPWAAFSMMGASTRNNPQSRFPFPTLWENELWNNPKISVALVDSFCLGAGMWLTHFCDIVLATDNAVFAYPPIRYGASITPYILPPWILGLRKTMELATTGRFMTAQEAYDCGFITKIVSADQLEREGKELCESVAKVPPMTNYFSKLSVHAYYEGLGMKNWSLYALANVMMTEQSKLPGHYLDFFENLVFKKGFTEAYKEQRERWGYPDQILDKEVKRLKEKKGKNG